MYLMLTGYQPPGHSIPSPDELEWAYESRTRRKPEMPSPHPTQPPSSPMLCAPSSRNRCEVRAAERGRLLGVANEAVASQQNGLHVPLHRPAPLQRGPVLAGSPSRPLMSKEGRTAGYLLPMHCGHSLATSLSVVPTRPCEVGLSPPLYRSGNKGSRKRLCVKWHSESVGVNLKTQGLSLQASYCLHKARGQQ